MTGAVVKAPHQEASDENSANDQLGDDSHKGQLEENFSYGNPLIQSLI